MNTETNVFDYWYHPFINFKPLVKDFIFRLFYCKATNKILLIVRRKQKGWANTRIITKTFDTDNVTVDIGYGDIVAKIYILNKKHYILNVSSEILKFNVDVTQKKRPFSLYKELNESSVLTLDDLVKLYKLKKENKDAYKYIK